jgi:hypothetical protein
MPVPAGAGRRPASGWRGWRVARWRAARECCRHVRQGAGECAGFVVRQPCEQLAELLAEEELRGLEHLLPRRGKGERLPATVGGNRRALDQPGFCESG